MQDYDYIKKINDTGRKILFEVFLCKLISAFWKLEALDYKFSSSMTFGEPWPYGLKNMNFEKLYEFRQKRSKCFDVFYDFLGNKGDFDNLDLSLSDCNFKCFQKV